MLASKFIIEYVATLMFMPLPKIFVPRCRETGIGHLLNLIVNIFDNWEKAKYFFCIFTVAFHTYFGLGKGK